MKQERLPGENPTRRLRAEWLRTGWTGIILSRSIFLGGCHHLQKPPYSDFESRCRGEFPTMSSWHMRRGLMKEVSAENITPFTGILHHKQWQDFCCNSMAWSIPYKTGGLSSYPFKGDWFWMSLPQRTPWLKPPQTSRNRAIHLARISAAISTYRNWIWLTWSFHEHFLPSTRVAIAGKYWGRAPTAIHSAWINYNGVVPKARHRFRRMSLLRVVFSLQKQNLQRIPRFYHANLWSGRFRVLRSRKWTSFWPAMIITTMWSPWDLMAHMPAAQGWFLEARPKWWVGVPAWKPAGSIYIAWIYMFFFQNTSDSPKRGQDWQKHRLNAAHEVLKSGTDFRDITAGSWECSR